MMLADRSSSLPLMVLESVAVGRESLGAGVTTPIELRSEIIQAGKMCERWACCRRLAMSGCREAYEGQKI